MDLPAPRWDLNWSTLWDGVVRAAPHAPAVIMGDLVRTYRELEDRSARLAAAFVRMGVGRADKVGVCAYNLPEYLEVVYAAFKLGAVPVNMNFRYGAKELAQLLQTSRARVVVHPSSLRASVSAAVGLVDDAIVRIEVDDDRSPTDERAVHYEAELQERWDPDPNVDHRSGADELFMFTGGTTGTPKAVVWRHGDLLDAQLVSIAQPLSVPVPQSVPELTSLAVRVAAHAPTTLPLAPFMHATALFMAMDTLAVGGTVVLTGSARFDPAHALAVAGSHGVTQLIIAGNAIALPLLEALTEAEVDGEPYDLSPLRAIISSGMAWTDEVKAGILARTDATLMDILGSSEGGPYAYSFVSSASDLPSRIELARGAVVLDESGHPVAPGEAGVLAYSGPMPTGYFEDPERTAKTYRVIDGVRWVTVGDWVRLLDDRGGIEFLGRGSAVVNTGGEKVYPAEVEEALLQHPAVTDAAVFGVADARWGQVVVAAVAAPDAAAVSEESLRVFAKARLAGYKAPQRIVVLPSLDRSPSGKLDLAKLTALFDA